MKKLVTQMRGRMTSWFSGGSPLEQAAFKTLGLV